MNVHFPPIWRRFYRHGDVPGAGIPLTTRWRTSAHLCQSISMEIKVLRRPIGEAPEWVRDAWIGLSLPLEMERKRNWVGLGVLSGPTNVPSQIWALLRGKGFKVTGYSVNAKTAVNLLAEVQPEAAQWWRENTPRLLTGSRQFIFDAAACEPVQVKE